MFSFAVAIPMAAAQTILLVEDEVAVRNFYQLYLEHHGFKVCPAASISEALRCLREQTVILAVIDIYLGEDNGLDLVRGMKSARPDLPVIVISGISYEEPMFQEALKTGADGVYSKTLPMAQLLIDIQRLLTPRGRLKASRAT
jgi:DNA-binding response OmpR family regulator